MSTALVTGASRGLGLALVKRLAADGWTIVVDGRDDAALLDATRNLGESAIAVPGDVSDAEHRLALSRAVASQGRLDLLVNNASILGPSPQPTLADYPLEVLAAVYDVNVLAALALIQLFLPQLKNADGTVINITSDAAVEGYEGWGGYGSSKAALEQISNVLAVENPDVSVYWADPGDMNTRMHQEAFPGEDISDRPPPEDRVPGLMHLINERPPSGRYRLADLAESR